MLLPKLSERLKEQALSSTIRIVRLTIVEEMFFAHDLTVQAALKDNVDLVQIYETQMFKLGDRANAPCYRIDGWRYSDGHPVTRQEMINVLNHSLSAHLLNRYEAHLYDPRTAELPKARVYRLSRWMRFKQWLRERFYV